MAKIKKERTFDESMHIYGRIGTLIALTLMLLVPLFVALYFHASPDMKGMLMGALSICIIYLPSSIIEVITYAPMLGTGATYLAFITGNLTNLKIPCCMTARDIVGTKYGTKENEIISTISVAVSSLVTCTVLILGVLLLAPLTPILQSPVLQPAFNTVVPALFGALGYKYFSKTPLVAVGAVSVHDGVVPAGAGGGVPGGDFGAGVGADFHRGGRLLYVKGVLQ